MSLIRSSYLPGDVELLLQPVNVTHTDVANKERLIQSGARHYSEMLSHEAPPTPEYLDIYRDALALNGDRMARETAALARGIAEQVPTRIVLVSLVRAGLPLGVLLSRLLRRMGRDVHHYGVSIIRDRGLDGRAMEAVTKRHARDSIIFVDGWTGKGAISTELARSWPDARLAVLADMGGFAWLSASGKDWLIPSGILGGVVSGLISRTVLDDRIIASGSFHGAVEQHDLSVHDLSRPFVDDIEARAVNIDTAPATPLSEGERTSRRDRINEVITTLAAREDVSNLNRLKPGIAEATRAVLRRRPRKVYLSEDESGDLSALRHLIRRDGLDHEIRPDLLGPYRAVTVIEKTS